MDLVVLDKGKVEKEIEFCHEQIKYWEQQYRNAYTNNDEFYKKCYWRQINRWQARELAFHTVLQDCVIGRPND